jgi:hypothetical protein
MVVTAKEAAILFSVHQEKCQHFQEKKIFINFKETYTFTDVLKEIHPFKDIEETTIHKILCFLSRRARFVPFVPIMKPMYSWGILMVHLLSFSSVVSCVCCLVWMGSSGSC